MRPIALALLLLVVPAVAKAHHSGSEYDRTTVEIEGTLVELVWQNPHVHFGVRTVDAKGKAVTWDIEANSLSILRRTDANPDNLKLGDRIKVAGAPSRQTPNKMWASNILPANGREVVLVTDDLDLGYRHSRFKEGSAAGDIVVSATFLIASESRLRAALSQW